MNTRKIIGQRIRQLREMNMMNQLDLAQCMKITQASLARYETGVSCPNEEQLVWLADHFNVSLDWLFGRANIQKGEYVDTKKQKKMEFSYPDGKHVTNEELMKALKNLEEMIAEMNEKGGRR